MSGVGPIDALVGGGVHFKRNHEITIPHYYIYKNNLMKRETRQRFTNSLIALH